MVLELAELIEQDEEEILDMELLEKRIMNLEIKLDIALLQLEKLNEKYPTKDWKPRLAKSIIGK